MDDQARPSSDSTTSNPWDAARGAQDGDPHQRVDPGTAFGELSKLVLGAQFLAAVLQRVAELAKAVIPDVREVSVTLMQDDQPPETVVFTGFLADQLDRRQYEAGSGPCMDAAVSGRTIPLSNSRPDSPYPEFSRAALQLGVSHSLSVGMPVPQRFAGAALNLYAAEDKAFDQQAVELAETFAGYAAAAIANGALYSSTTTLAAQMQTALQFRRVIEQAKGITMRRHRCTAAEALTILVTTCQRRSQGLRDIAQEIVDGAVRD